jgi:PPE-repeat protein
MPDPLWFGPPESVAALLEASNPSTIVANIAAWLAESIQHELSMGMSVANVAATLEQWIGVGGAAYGMKGSELNFLGLQPLAAHCLKHMAIGQSAVEANTVARSAVIPALVCQTNRDETAALYASNICGCNTPAIAANEEMYWGNFTPQNMNIGLTYATALNTLMGSIVSTPPPITPAGFSSPAAPVEAAAQSAADSGVQASSGLGEAAGQAASPAGGATDGLQSFMGAAQGLFSGATQPLQEMASGPTQALSSGTQSFTGLLQNFMGGFSGMGSPNAAAAESAAAGLAGPLGGAGGGAAGSLGGGAGAVGAGYPGAGLTSFTRPASTFEPDGGRPTGLRPSGVLNAADLRGPTTTGTGGAAMPMSPATAGMLGRGENAGSDKSAKDGVTHARIVVDRDRQEV